MKHELEFLILEVLFVQFDVADQPFSAVQIGRSLSRDLRSRQFADLLADHFLAKVSLPVAIVCLLHLYDAFYQYLFKNGLL